MVEVVPMSLTIQHKKEALGQAYIRAIIAKAGYNLAKDEFDYGFDGTIKAVDNRGGRRVDSGFGINFQLKSSCEVDFKDGEVIYDLESKNYNDLVAEVTTLPNILILFVLPKDESDWINCSFEHLIIRRCAWWYSLAGMPPTNNPRKKRIKIPEQQMFSPEELHKLMDKVKGGSDRL